jgi:hypothetical protein
MLNDLTFSLLKQHVRFVQLINNRGSADLDLRHAFPRLVFFCVENRLERKEMFLKKPPLRIEVFQPIPIDELARKACPMWWNRAEGDGHPMRTSKQMLEDTRTLIIRKGGCLLPAANIEASYVSADARQKKPEPKLRFQLVEDLPDSDIYQTLNTLMDAFASTKDESGKYTIFGEGYGFSGSNLRIEIICHRSALDQLIQIVSRPW